MFWAQKKYYIHKQMKVDAVNHKVVIWYLYCAGGLHLNTSFRSLLSAFSHQQKETAKT